MADRHSVNNLNQYTNIRPSNCKDILGVALAYNAVTVNSQTADRRGEYFHQAVATVCPTFDYDGDPPAWQSFTISKSGFSTNGGVVIAAQPQAFAYDEDGNLVHDGVWTYRWDAQNRLVGMVMTNVSGLPNAQRKSL